MTNGNPLTGYVARLLLGRRLRQLREQRNLHSEDAASQSGVARATLWRMEKGDVRCRCKLADVGGLAQLYGADEQTTKPLLELAEATRTRSWISAFRDLLPEVAEAYIELEGHASRMRCYVSAAIPDLLQTEEYAKATIAASGKLSAIEVATHTHIRLNRQAIAYGRGDAIEMTFIIDEAVFSREVNQSGVMSGQLERLIECANLKNVTIQLAPFRAGIYPGLDAGSFTILDFPDNDQYGSPPKTVHVNRLGEQLLLDKPADIEAYEECWNDIHSRVLDESASRARWGCRGLAPGAGSGGRAPSM